MYGKKVKLRLLFLSFIFLIVALSVFLILKSLEENVVYFISPTEIKNLPEIPQIWGIQSPETSEILNAHSNYKLSHLTYAHVFTNTRPRDCAITRVQRQRTSPSTQRFPNSKAYIHRVLQVFHSVF